MPALILRAMAWRPGASLAVLAVAVIASMAAALGPLYARSVEESLVIDRLSAAGPGSGLRASAESSVQSPWSVQDLLTAATAAATVPGLDETFGPIVRTESSVDTQITRPNGQVLGIAWVAWQSVGCAGVHLVRGRCASGPDEVVVSDRTLSQSQLALGGRLQLALQPQPPAGGFRIVGVYDAGSGDPRSWGTELPARANLPPGKDVPHLDDVLGPREVVENSLETFRVDAYRPFNAARLSLDALPGTVRLLTDAENRARGAADLGQSPQASLSSDLPHLVTALDTDRQNVRTATFAITAQLIALALMVFWLVVSAATQERTGEVVLAKLRGMRPLATAVFGLAETVVLLTVAAPLGLLLAVLADHALVAAVLVRGTTVQVGPSAWLALGGAFLGGLITAALAARQTLQASILQQLQPTSGGRGARLGAAAIDVLAVALAVEGIWQLHTGASDAVALVTPGLLALAGGLLVVRILVPLAGIGVRRSRSSARVAGFVAVRNLARRSGAGRLVVLLSVAVALAVFGVEGWAIGRDVRVDRARVQLGAPVVLHVSAQSPAQVLDAVRRLDPAGRWAMAAAQVPGDTVAVDSTRLAAVSSWDPAWVRASWSDLAAALHPAAAPPVAVTGSLAVLARYSASPGTPAVELTATVRAADGLTQPVDLGTLHTGRATYRAALPGCAGGCRLSNLTISSNENVPQSITTQLVVTALQDAHGTVDAGLTSAQRWQPGLSAFGLMDPRTVHAEAVSADSAGLSLVADQQNLSGVVAEVADHPAQLPAVLGTDTGRTPYSEQGALIYTTGLTTTQGVARVLRFSGTVPRLGRTGTLVDLPYGIAASRGPWSTLDFQVWLGPAAPPVATVRTRLTAAGLVTRTVERQADRVALLDRDGTALALWLFTVAAALAVVLAAGTMLANSYLSARRRSYELAVLRSLGGRRRLLLAAVRWEQVVLAVIGIGVGAGFGLAALVATLRVLPTVSGAGLAPVPGGVQAMPLLVLVVILAVILVLADVGARRTVRAARLELLRQGQA